jgi:hypothetical protein
MVVEYISVTAECRRLARNVVSADFSDPAIESYQKKRFSRISTLTDKDDWDEDDREFGELQRIETELVASDIIEHYGDASTMEIWTTMREYANADLAELIKNMDTATDTGEEAEAEVGKTALQNWNDNPNTPPPNLLTNVSGVEGMSFDRDF